MGFWLKLIRMQNNYELQKDLFYFLALRELARSYTVTITADEFDILFWVKGVKPAPQAYWGPSLRYQLRFAPPMSFPKLHPCCGAIECTHLQPTGRVLATRHQAGRVGTVQLQTCHQVSLRTHVYHYCPRPHESSYVVTRTTERQTWASTPESTNSK